MKEELKEYYCFNDYIMECPVLKGKAAFLKGKKYLFNNQMIAKSEVYNEHDLSDEIDFDKHFILQSEWDLLQQKSGKLPKEQLIGMTAFVLEQYKLFIQDKITSEQFRNNVWNYANFLSRQPQLSDFVPCGEDGLPLEKPYEGLFEIQANQKCSGWKYLSKESGNERYYDAVSYAKAQAEYQQALDKVLFKGFEIVEENFIHNTKHYYLQIGNRKIAYNFNNGWLFYSEYETLESLTPYNLELTDNVKNIINGNI